MLTTGKRVIVLNSSEVRRGAHVRRGSTGFIIETGTAHIHSFRKKSVLIVPTYISFSRFGFEKKIRRESKWVHAVLPLFRISEDDPDKLNQLLLTLTKNKSVPKRNNTFITLKLSPTDIVENEREFSNWFISAISSHNFEVTLMQRRNTKLNSELRSIMNYLGISRPFFMWLSNKVMLSHLTSTIFKSKDRYKLFKLIFTKLSLIDMIRVDAIKDSHSKLRIAPPPFMDQILCTDLWFLSLLNNNDIKFTGDTLRLANIISSVNNTLRSS